MSIRTPDIATEVNSLSGGNQQKIVLAKLLETGSKIFLMNEPTRGIDVGAKVDIYQMMENLCEAGAGIVMISSELPEMLSMADRIIVIAKGRVTAEFSRAGGDAGEAPARHHDCRPGGLTWGTLCTSSRDRR